jgi:hypothetical protein
MIINIGDLIEALGHSRGGHGGHVVSPQVKAHIEQQQASLIHLGQLLAAVRDNLVPLWKRIPDGRWDGSIENLYVLAREVSAHYGAEASAKAAAEQFGQAPPPPPPPPPGGPPPAPRATPEDTAAILFRHIVKIMALADGDTDNAALDLAMIADECSAALELFPATKRDAVA